MLGTIGRLLPEAALVHEFHAHLPGHVLCVLAVHVPGAGIVRIDRQAGRQIVLVMVAVAGMEEHAAGYGFVRARVAINFGKSDRIGPPALGPLGPGTRWKLTLCFCVNVSTPLARLSLCTAT